MEQEENFTSAVLKEVLDSKNLTMATTVVSDSVLVAPVRNALVVALYPLQIDVPSPLPPPLPLEPLPMIPLQKYDFYLVPYKEDDVVVICH